MKIKNILTDKEYDKLERNSINCFSLKVKKIDILKGICGHRSKDGEKSMLEYMGDGTCKCKLCKRKIKFLSTDIENDGEEVQKIVDDMIGLIETIKMMFVDIPEEAGRQIYSIIPMLEKIPKLYELALKSFSKYNLANSSEYQYNSPQAQINMLNHLISMTRATLEYNTNSPYYQGFAETKNEISNNDSTNGKRKNNKKNK